jgi:pyruvate/2-oxoglutarate dehydrogenase complex dihydrolipoamide acyltransferase (E2) component
MPDFKLPDLGEGVTEAEIDRWLVEEGQEITEDDPLVDVITDKATAEIPSPYSGVVNRIHIEAGTVVPVGTVLITIGEPERGDGEVQAEQVGLPAGFPSGSTGEPVDREGQSKALPPVRKLARDLDIDINSVRGSGPEGRVLREDIEAAAGTAAFAAPAPAERRGRREPFRGVRRMIAEHVQAAHSVIPPVTHVEECDLTELDATRRVINERDPDAPKLKLLPFVVKAVVTSLRRHPELNSTLDEAANEIVYHERYDIGIAVAAPQGLVVPVVKDAEAKSLRAIADDIETLAAGARAGTLRTEELRGSTFTITSPGRFGGLMATPIINYPEAAILGVHRAARRPVVRDEQIVIRLMANLSITFDHRLIDGVAAGGFCLDVVQLLEHPAALMLEP